MRAQPALVIMAKEPRLQQVKTRLSAALSDEETLELYRAFLDDKIEQVASVRGARPYLAFTPPEAAEAMEAIAGGRAELIAQRGADLGERLAHVAEDLFAAGATAVVLVDSDTPNLPTVHLEEALLALAGGVDVVLGPAWDGGYYLLGLSRPSPELFQGIPWSTRAVLRRTVERVRESGRSLHLLPAWYDVDQPADLDRLADDLRRASGFTPGHPKRTAAVLSRHPRRTTRAPRDEHWKTLSLRRVYQNPWIDVDESIVDIGGGALTLYGVVTCARAVGVLPRTDEGKLLLVRQFRYVARRSLWEMPTGGAKTGESIEDAAQRELREETGRQAGRLLHLATYHTSKSVLDEVADLYLGDQLSLAPAVADDTEQIEVGAFTMDEVLAMIEKGEIVDSMTVVAVLTLLRRGA